MPFPSPVSRTPGRPALVTALLVMLAGALLAATPAPSPTTPFTDGDVVTKKSIGTPLATGAAGLDGQAGGLRLRVAAYNIAHARGNKSGFLHELGRMKNLRGIADLLIDQKVDIACFEEISSRDLRAGFRDQPEYLAKKLGFAHRVYGENVSELKGILATQGNAVISRFPILSHRNHFLYRKDKKQEQRGCLEVLIDLGGGRKVRLFVTHLSLNSEESTRQIQDIWALIEKSEEPVIFVGDFNSRPGSDRIKWLKQRMTDTTSNLTTTYLNKPDVKIDYHFTKGAVTGGTAWIRGFDEGYSDHGCLLNDYLVR
ncbi:MAG: hypothetical protein GX442_15100 [Candidatus Riflebacteria bacterium]|nr:hypothetical protein [Candidatus Riflebacteria bacterium]